MTDPGDREPASTIVAHDERHFGNAVVPPIFQTSLFTFASYDEMAASQKESRRRSSILMLYRH